MLVFNGFCGCFDLCACLMFVLLFCGVLVLRCVNSVGDFVLCVVLISCWLLVWIRCTWILRLTMLWLLFCFFAIRLCVCSELLVVGCCRFWCLVIVVGLG